MAINAQGEVGRIRLFNDFFGAGSIANTEDTQSLQPFYVGGEGNEDADTGVAVLDGLSGVVRMTGGNTDADTTFIGTPLAFDIALMAPLVAEVRVQMPDVDTKELFFGITSILTLDEQLEDIIINASATAVTVVADCAGFYFSDELTASATTWHAFHGGGTTADSATAATATLSGSTVTAGEWQVLRLEVDPNGTARWYVDGDLKKTVEGAVSTTSDVAVCLATGANTTELVVVDVDYMLVKANRDWNA